MTAVVNGPPTDELIDTSTTKGKSMDVAFMRARLTTGWQTFLSQLYQAALSVTMSGTTANRPTKLLWIGRRYFDTTLTKPVWVKAVSGAGVATWCDATGTTV